MRRGWFGESYRHYLAAKGVRSYLKPKLETLAAIEYGRGYEQDGLKVYPSTTIRWSAEEKAAARQREALDRERMVEEMRAARKELVKKLEGGNGAPPDFAVEFNPLTGTLVVPRGVRVPKDPERIVKMFGVTKEEAREIIREAKEREREAKEMSEEFE